MAHIGVSVDDETKRSWAEYVDESEYGSMSELVRTAVRKEIRRGDGGDQLPRQVEKELVQVAEDQQSIRDTVAALSEDFEAVKDAAESQYPEEIVELAMDISEGLEEVHADQFAEVEADARNDLRGLAERHLGDPKRVGEVAEALEYLRENLSYIRTPPRTSEDYYRVVGREYDR
jgi:Arc/MetJ-type ribon-helix-helix transcriptional regulator